MAGEVSFTCRRTVISTKPVQPGKFIPLSVLNHIMERHYLHLIFYYSLSTKRAPGELTQKLKESISNMLCAYPAARGRLVTMPEGHRMIKCNDAGVRMVEARVKGTVNDWLKTVTREKEMKLVHLEDRSQKPYFWSTFSVQITEFECGGVAISLSCTQLLSDPICATMMIKAWADTMLHGELETLPSFVPLPIERSADQQRCSSLIDYYKLVLEKPDPVSNTKHTTITLQFGEEEVRNCIAIAITSDTDHHDPTLMPFVALTALFWARISKVKGMEGSLLDMSVCLDARKVLGLEKGFFGNCMVFSQVRRDGLDKNKLSKAAECVNEAVARIDGDGVTGLIEWLEQENWENLPWMNCGHLVCVSLENAECPAVFGGNRKSGSSIVLC